ncbi:DUF2256 domain-containing protein [Mucilaginibacter gynuensis]|uniref:DUF2256 domain-containing protein n=1 Tax=Mucilaginibacter gynuensis TaxID=1302236 RepID=UPI0031ECAB3A
MLYYSQFYKRIKCHGCICKKLSKFASITSASTKHTPKHNLPHKICAVCNKPFSWRKKWAKCWADVKYCSERCRRNK